MGSFVKSANGGGSTIIMSSAPSVKSFAAAVGKKEADGPLGACFDYVGRDVTFGLKSWEKGEGFLQSRALTLALQKGALSESDLSFIFAGDLLNQCVASGYNMRDFAVPFVGLYGACSTMAESLALASVFVESSLVPHAAALTSSHFCSAERQFRAPLNYGGQRTPTAQWTATAAGCAIVAPRTNPPYVNAVTFGRVWDYGVKDATNMGAAMAPSAYHTITAHLENTGKSLNDFDYIVTGDLGKVGSVLLCELFEQGQDENADFENFREKHLDCGVMLYDHKLQDTHAGGSGCGCSAAVLCGYFLNEIAKHKLDNILFVATGALMSPTMTQQGESVPSVSHAVHISAQ